MQIKKVTLEVVINKDKVSKAGKAYTSQSIITTELGEKVWLNGFKNKENEHWAKGDTVEIAYEEREYVAADGQTKTSLNFKPAKQLSDSEKEVIELKAKLAAVEAPTVQTQEQVAPEKDDGAPEVDENGVPIDW